MKKSIVLASLMLITAAMFAAPKAKAPATPASTEPVVVFDPAVDGAKYGEVVKVNGESFLKITVDGYQTVLSIDPVNCSGKTEFTSIAYAAESNEKFNLSIYLKDEGFADISNIPFYQIKTDVTPLTAGPAKKESWNTVSKTKICTVIQPMVQDATKNYAPQSGVTVYIGKIIAK